MALTSKARRVVYNASASCGLTALRKTLVCHAHAGVSVCTLVRGVRWYQHWRADARRVRQLQRRAAGLLRGPGRQHIAPLHSLESMINVGCRTGSLVAGLLCCHQAISMPYRIG